MVSSNLVEVFPIVRIASQQSKFEVEMSRSSVLKTRT